MSNIVERLRRTGASGWTDAIQIGTDLELEAADEIERLQEAKRRALGVADEKSKENAELRQEIERLRKIEAAVAGTAGDPDRSEFHRGWHACCQMVLAVQRLDNEQ